MFYVYVQHAKKEYCGCGALFAYSGTISRLLDDKSQPVNHPANSKIPNAVMGKCEACGSDVHLTANDYWPILSASPTLVVGSDMWVE